MSSDLLRNPSRSARSDGAFLVAWAALCVLLPLLMLGEHPGQASPLALYGQALAVLYSGTRLAMLIRNGRPLWFDTMFWAFAYIWIALAGLAQLTAGDNPYHISLSMESYEAAVLLTLVGFVSYDVGRLLAPQWAKGVPHLGKRVVAESRVRAMVVAALAVTPVLIILLGGWRSFLITRTERTTVLATSGLLTDSSKVTGGILLALTNSLPLIALLGVVALLQSRPDLRRHFGWLVVIGLIGGLAMFVGNPISNPRFWTGTIILSVLFSLHWANTRRGFRVIISCVFFALLVVFPYADRFRYAGQAVRRRPLNDLMVTKLDYDASVQMVNSIDFVHATGGTHGHQILGVLGFYVPRSIWPGKPGATGSLLTQFAGFPLKNVSSPLWVEAYVDGGFLAVALSFAGLSILAAWAQRSLGRGKGQSIDWQTLLMPVLAAYSIIMLRGSLLSGVGALVTLTGLTYLLTEPSGKNGPSGSLARSSQFHQRAMAGSNPRARRARIR